MITRIVLILLCSSLLSTVNGCSFDSSRYNNQSYYRGEGRVEQKRSDDEQERQQSRRDKNQDARGDASGSGLYDHGDTSGQDRFGR